MVAVSVGMVSLSLVVITGIRIAHADTQMLRGGAWEHVSNLTRVDDGAKRQAIEELKKSKKAAAFAFPVWTVPTMANVQGQFGAFFKTRVIVFNPTTFSYTLAARLYNQNGVVDTRTITLPANNSRLWDDFLGEVFNYYGAGGVEFDSWFIPPGGSSDFDFFVTAEVYTESPNGRYKTMVVNGMRPDSFTGSWRTTSVGISANANERTNLGVLNDSSSTASVQAAVYNSSGQLLEIVSFSVPGHGWAQKPVTASVTNGTINWTTNKIIYAWAVTVDNRSNDGSLTYPIFYIYP